MSDIFVSKCLLKVELEIQFVLTLKENLDPNGICLRIFMIDMMLKNIVNTIYIITIC